MLLKIIRKRVPITAVLQQIRKTRLSDVHLRIGMRDNLPKISPVAEKYELTKMLPFRYLRM